MRYEETNPWITFDPGFLKLLDHKDWLLLGEADSKCEHIAGVPLQPAYAKHLNQIFLVKNIHATTQIEGNTLSEEEVGRRLDHDLPLPPSQEYMGQEIDNIVKAHNLIVEDVFKGASLRLTPERIKEFNRIVLEGLPPKEGVTPGEIREHSVLVGNSYRGAPAADCDYLVERLCDWLEDLKEQACAEPELVMPVAFVSAILAHLYLAWIHPFGDGNGRTARLIEVQLLAQAKVPTVAAHVLSDHYNRTRSEYLRILALTSKPHTRNNGSTYYDINPFIRYALQGFVDGLAHQIDMIRSQQLLVTWQNFVHEKFRDHNTEAFQRQKHLILALPPNKITPVSQIRELTPKLAVDYATKQQRTVSRDVNSLEQMELILRTRSGIQPNIDQIRAFLPLRASADAS